MFVYLQYPEEVSEDEEAVIEYYRDTCDAVPQPIVNLDV